MVLLSADGSFNHLKVEQLLKSDKVRVVTFRISSLASLISDYKCILEMVKKDGSSTLKPDKVLFLVSRADRGSYHSDEESKKILQDYPVAFGEDITIGAANGKVASLLGRVKGCDSRDSLSKR